MHIRARLIIRLVNIKSRSKILVFKIHGILIYLRDFGADVQYVKNVRDLIIVEVDVGLNLG